MSIRKVVSLVRSTPPAAQPVVVVKGGIQKLWLGASALPPYVFDMHVVARSRTTRRSTYSRPKTSIYVGIYEPRDASNLPCSMS